jgi:hypothetical protein
MRLRRQKKTKLRAPTNPALAKSYNWPQRDVTLYLVSLDPSPIPPRWQQFLDRWGDPTREFPTTGQRHTPTDGFAGDSAFAFFRASGAATRGRSGAMRIQSS